MNEYWWNDFKINTKEKKNEKLYGFVYFDLVSRHINFGGLFNQNATVVEELQE